MKCQGKWQSIYRVGKNSPTYDTGFSEKDRMIYCKSCGTKIIVTRKLKETKKYCSYACKIKDTPRTMSFPHLEVIKILKLNKIKHENEFSFGRYSIDIKIKNTNLFIEIMGTYWHSDKRFYPSPIDEIQSKAIKRDSKKNKVIIENNMIVLYVWEKDIVENYRMCEKLIMRFISKNGNIDNYHSSNYTLNGNQLLLNAKILDIGY